MSGRLSIGAARTRARYVGNVGDKAAVTARLNSLLAGPVAMRLADMAAELGQDEVICLPDVTVKLRLTRAELDSSSAADRWAAAIVAAVAQPGRTGPMVWRFAHRRAFHASYIRHRLGLMSAPPSLFGGFGALNLLSPLRAMAEMLAADPGLWAALADGGPVAVMDLVRSIVAQSGDGGVTMVLARAAEGPAAAAGQSVEGLRPLLGQLPGVLALMPPVPADFWPSLPLPAQRLLAALLISSVTKGNPVPLAGLFAVLMALVRRSGVVGSEAMIEALSMLKVECGSDLSEAGALVKLTRQSTDFASEVIAVLPAVTKFLSAKGDRSAVLALGAIADVSGATAPKAKARASPLHLSHFIAPFSGVALVLPHLTEDRIGAAFAASDRLAALAQLIRSDLFPAPDTSDFLRALVGTDDKDRLPDRPNHRDLLFIPKARHDLIMAAEPGAPRLAHWLQARFAATLPGLAASSLAFLQRQFFHIPGEVWIDRDQITLRLDPMPLLAVLEMAGRCGVDLARLDWFDRQRLTIRCERGQS